MKIQACPNSHTHTHSAHISIWGIEIKQNIFCFKFLLFTDMMINTHYTLCVQDKILPAILRKKIGQLQSGTSRTGTIDR